MIQYDVFGNVVPQKCDELEPVEGVDYVISRLNGKRYRLITYMHVKANGLKDLDEYKQLFPDSLLRCSDAMEKFKRTNIERFGVEYPMQSEIIHDKAKSTTFEKLGVKYPTQHENVRDKVKLTVSKKYGVENVFQSELIKEQIKRSNLENYGPSELHYHIQHNIKTGKNMNIINILAFQYLNGYYNG